MIYLANNEEKNQIKAIWDELFNFDDDGWNNYYFDNVYDKGKHYLLKKDDEIVSIASDFKSNYMINKKLLKVSMIVGVATKKEYQGKGYMKELMMTLLDILAHQELVTMIQAYDPKFYEAFGFETLYYRKKYYITKDNFKITETKGMSENIILDDCLKAYALFVKHFNAYKLRSIDDFSLILKENEILDKYMVSVYDGSQIKGYFIFRLDKNQLIIEECIYLDTKTLTKIISYALKVADEVVLELSDNEDIEKLYGPLKSEVNQYTMVKINDYALFNKLYETDVKNVKEAFSLVNKPLYMHEVF